MQARTRRGSGTADRDLRGAQGHQSLHIRSAGSARFGTLVESAARLCQAQNVQIFLRDGEIYRLAAHNGFSPEYQQFVKQHPIAPGRGTPVARTALTAATVHLPDALSDPEYTWHEGRRLGGYRTMLGIPLLRGGKL